MQLATYVIYELLIRMQELNPNIGDFVSCKKTEDQILVQTTTGNVSIPNVIYEKQFQDPSRVTLSELLDLL